MSGTALLFPGMVPIGPRAVLPFLAEHPLARRRMSEAEEALGEPLLKRFTAEGEEDIATAESVFLVACQALADVVETTLPDAPDLCAGPSAGSFTAAAHTGAVPFGRLVVMCREATVIQLEHLRAATPRVGCHFIYRAPLEALEDLCARLRREGGWAEVTVRLGHGVHAVSAAEPALSRVAAEVNGLGGHLMYSTDRIEHCAPAAGFARAVIEQVYDPEPFAPVLRLPYLSYLDGGTVTSGRSMREVLGRGWTEPLIWDHTTRGLRRHGVRRVVVAGPRGMFTSLTQKSLGPSVNTLAATPEWAMELLRQ